MEEKQKQEILADKVAEMNHGEFISHTDIGELIQARAGTNKYYTVVAAAQKMLLVKGKLMKNVSGKGYEILPPDEYTDMAIHHYNAGARALTKGQKTLEYAPVEIMSEGARSNYNLVCDKTKVVNAALRGAVVELELLNRPKQHPLLMLGKEQ